MEARDLRVTDAEREHVGVILQRAVGRGLLSLDEFTERIDAALAARTRGELNVVLVDLPGMRMIAPPTPVEVPITVARPPLPSLAHGREIIRGRMSGIVRTGRWRVPAGLLLNNRFANVVLDFTAAVIATQVVEIAIDDLCTSLTLVVTGDATVDVEGLALLGSTVTNECHAGPPPGRLHLAVHGRSRFGTVTVRRPVR